MKKIALALMTTFLMCQLSFADDMSCDAKAADKKLNGAAKNSFIKKCEKDAKAMTAKTTCDAKATEKKLYGAAKNSFTKKCVADASK